MRKDYIASSFRLVADVLRIGFGDEVGLGFDIEIEQDMAEQVPRLTELASCAG